MPERGLCVRRVRLCAVVGAAILLSPALAAAASGKAKKTEKMCGGGVACSTSLSSSGSGTSPPLKPSSTFHVSATAASPVVQPITSGSQIVEKLDPGSRLTCLGYRRKDASWFAFMLNTQTSIDITYRVTDTITDTTPSEVHFCLGAPYEFQTEKGGQARRSILPDGTLGYTGLLPPCRALPTTPATEPRPCVISARKRRNSSSKTGFDTVLSVRVPAVTKGGDPWGGG